MEAPPRERSTPSGNQERFPDPTIELEKVSTPEEFIKAIDFNVLNDIYDALAERSRDVGTSSTSGHRINPDKIEFTTCPEVADSIMVSGSADIENGSIEISWIHTEDVTSRYRAISTLKTLAHESTHVRGGYLCESRHESGVSGFVIRRGLWENVYQRGKEHIKDEIVGVSLNEAVTEEISHEVLREYLRRTGHGEYFQDEALANELGIGAYAVDRFVLKFLVEALSQRLNVSQSDVWKGIVHAYMNGNQDISGLLAEVQSEVAATPHLAELITLGAERSFPGDDSVARLMDAAVIRSDEAARAIRQVAGVLDGEKFQDVLGLR